MTNGERPSHLRVARPGDVAEPAVHLGDGSELKKLAIPLGFRLVYGIAKLFVR